MAITPHSPTTRSGAPASTPQSNRNPHRASGVLWGLIALAISGLVLLRALDVVPQGLYDLVVRAWPTLLIVAGLGVLLRNRIPFGGFIALGISIALAVNIGALAFSSRSTQQRTDYSHPIAQPVSEGISLIEVNLSTLTTDLEIILTSDENTRAIGGAFVGSMESVITQEYSEGIDGRASLLLHETQPNAFQDLEAIGRGTLQLTLPTEIGVDLVINNQSGSTILNLDGVAIERLNLDLMRGDAIVTLPEYAPQSPTAQQDPNALTGSLTIRDGSLTMTIPERVAASLELNRGDGAFEPEFDELRYNYLRSDVLENRDIDDSPLVIRYALTVPRGRIRIIDAPSTS